MFRLFRNSNPHKLTPAVAQAFVAQGQPLGVNTSALAMLEQRGSYSGRNVTYFRVFDSARAADRGLQVHAYADLDSHPDLVLGAGHVEHDGVVILLKRDSTQVAPTPLRSEADRSVHNDDEQFVFPDGR